MPNSVPTVLFDVDGTLVDSNYLHTVAWSRALIDGGEWAPMNAIHRLIGMGSDNMLPRLIGRRDLSLSTGWRSHYDKLIDEVRAFPSAADLLRDIAASKVSVVLATSSPSDHIETLVRLLGVTGEFEATTSDDAERSKPDPEIFLTAMHRAGGDPSTTLVVGDSTWDIEAANAARLPCIGLESGGFSEAELTEAGAVAVYRDVASLRSRLRSSPIGTLMRLT